MSCVIGIDLSSHAIDLVRLDELDNHAEWLRVDLAGASAWDRTRMVKQTMPSASWWDEVYLCAVEQPFGMSRRAQSVLMRVQGAVLASIPQSIETWEVNVADWKKQLGLGTKKPTFSDLQAVMPGLLLEWRRLGVTTGFAAIPLAEALKDVPQDALDALAIAYYARETNAKGIAA